MAPLCNLIAIVLSELGPEKGAEVVTTALYDAAGAVDGAETVTDEMVGEELWQAFATEKPAAFVGSTRTCSGGGLAFRYALRRCPELITPVDLSAAEARMLNRTRRVIRDWSGLARWSRFRHLMYDEACTPLVATIALRGKYDGGFAFAFHRDLGHRAIYPRQRIGEYREVGVENLVGVLLHEESHLAVGRAVDWFRGGLVARAVYEAAAGLVGCTASLVAAGWEPLQREDLIDHLEYWEIEDLRQFVALFAAKATVPEIVRGSCELAVAAARGDEALAAATGRIIQARHPVRALEHIFVGA